MLGERTVATNGKFTTFLANRLFLRRQKLAYDGIYLDIDESTIKISRHSFFWLGLSRNFSFYVDQEGTSFKIRTELSR